MNCHLNNTFRLIPPHSDLLAIYNQSLQRKELEDTLEGVRAVELSCMRSEIGAHTDDRSEAVPWCSWWVLLQRQPEHLSSSPQSLCTKPSASAACALVTPTLESALPGRAVWLQSVLTSQLSWNSTFQFSKRPFLKTVRCKEIKEDNHCLPVILYKGINNYNS